MWPTDGDESFTQSGLDSLTGDVLWHNRLKGHGIGLATIATENNPGSRQSAVLAEKRHRDQQAAAGG